MKRLESPPSGHFMICRACTCGATYDPPPYCFGDKTNAINISVHWQFHTSDEIIFYSIETVNI